MKTLLFLDDLRNPFDKEIDWLVFSPLPREDLKLYWVKSYNEFRWWITTNGLPDGICFDHDLGMNVAIKAQSKGMSKRKSRQLKKEDKTGFDCAKWLVEYCIDNDKPLPLYNIQSANPVGKENIDKLLQNYLKHWESL
jgi:hypothetical protein